MLKRPIYHCFALVALLFSWSSYAQVDDSLAAHYYFKKFQDVEYVDTLLARVFADSGHYYAMKTGDPMLIGKSHQYLGWYHQDQSNFVRAREEFFKCLKEYKRINFTQGIADCYGNIGNSYFDMDLYQKALDYQLKALEANEKIIESNPNEDDLAYAQEGKTYALHNISSIYADVGLFKKALEYQRQSLASELKVQNMIGVAISFNAVAKTFKQLGNTDSAIVYFKKAQEVLKEHPYPLGTASNYRSYATMTNSGLSDEERRWMMSESMRIHKELGDRDGEIDGLLVIGDTEFDNLSMDSLGRIIRRAEILLESEDYDLDHHRQKYLALCARFYSRVGQHDLAYKYLSEYIELDEVSEELRKSHDLVLGDVKFQLQKKMIDDSVRMDKNFAVQRAVDQKKIEDLGQMITLGVVAGVILIALLIVVVSANRRRKRLNEELSSKNAQIREQKAIVEDKNQSISDSIQYAKRLQSAILPKSSWIGKFLDYFVFYQAKDIVSGDFYWFEEKQGVNYLAVADCTGHGVPGAMVSVVCANALDRALFEHDNSSPKDILNKTRELVIETFSQSDDNVEDGMDITLCAIDDQRNIVTFSGANNPLWIVREGKVDGADSTKELDELILSEFKGSKQPVGNYPIMKDFDQVEIKIQSGDQLYLFSDGYIDQFGGESGKKFKSTQLKKLILENAKSSLGQQRRAISGAFNHWKGSEEQVDDVCVIGVRIK